MHVPDHMISDPAEALAALGAAAAFTAVAARSRRPEGASSQPTLLAHPDRPGAQAATAALVFALQMVNFPVLPGTSGHLLGGALATALVGPRRALLATGAVVASQAVWFADGGVGALGVNLVLLAILPVALAASVSHLCRVGRSRVGPIAAAGAAALAAPALSAAAFTALHLAAGTAEVPAGRLASHMVGVHLAIGLGEAAVTVGVLLAVRRVGAVAVPTLAAASAAGLSLVASAAPDGLERVAGELGFAVAGPGSVLGPHSPLRDYALAGADGAWSAAVAGLAGLLLSGLAAAVLAHAAGATRQLPQSSPA